MSNKKNEQKMEVINILKDGTRTHSMKDVPVPDEIVLMILSVVNGCKVRIVKKDESLDSKNK
ncbi:hypothetical protein AB6883_12830 [Carnobacterium maltaromaticum]|uniref:hypothetical protein n=1 Tax=Carnobacterium maltaromaticum TaxID=2751 RepID=UPI00288FDC1B|nr:hypothetical protein [Carnobacterium maltaromaticum]MDT1943357.1 hypothetical protein [Carnobacterium maltaromaticum]MDT1998737.1 hypothetical protein [Carnobacterium maltaromaticum]